MIREDILHRWAQSLGTLVAEKDQLPPGVWAEVVEEMALELRAMSFYLRAVACPSCRGIGTRTYGDTSTWHGGVGGQTLTPGVCDKCWGTGRSDHKGVNLRLLKSEAEENQQLLVLLESECRNELVRGELEGLTPDGPHARLWSGLRDRIQARLGK